MMAEPFAGEGLGRIQAALAQLRHWQGRPESETKIASAERQAKARHRPSWGGLQLQRAPRAVVSWAGRKRNTLARAGRKLERASEAAILRFPIALPVRAVRWPMRIGRALMIAAIGMLLSAGAVARIANSNTAEPAALAADG